MKSKSHVNLVGTARCAVRAASQRRIAGLDSHQRRDSVPPAYARAGTSQRDVPTNQGRAALPRSPILRTKRCGPENLHIVEILHRLRAAATWWFISVALTLPAFAATHHATGSLTDAIAEARGGDTILIHGPRVFNERIVLTNSIRLIGTNSPVLDAGGSGTPLTIAAPDCEVRGLMIRNSGRDLTTFDSGVMITGARAVVRDCRIESDAFGIYIRGVNDCRIEANEISGRANLASAARGNGIHLWKTRRNHLLGNSIHDKRDGMYFSYADDNVIAGNRIWDTRFGIHYMYSHQNRLLTNSLTRNAVGATLMFSRGSLVQGNTVTANRRHGMVFKQLDTSRVEYNTIAGQNRGFFIQQATQNRFEGNVIATNDIGVYLSNCSEQNVFVGNAFVRNSDQVWQPPFETELGRKGPNSFSEKNRGNYWSDYTGNDRNDDGIGDTPYHETDVFGYIVDRHPEARVFALSPAVALLRKGEELMPLMDTSGVTDLAPIYDLRLIMDDSRAAGTVRSTSLTPGFSPVDAARGEKSFKRLAGIASIGTGLKSGVNENGTETP